LKREVAKGNRSLLQKFNTEMQTSKP